MCGQGNMLALSSMVDSRWSNGKQRSAPLCYQAGSLVNIRKERLKLSGRIEAQSRGMVPECGFAKIWTGDIAYRMGKLLFPGQMVSRPPPYRTWSLRRFWCHPLCLRLCSHISDRPIIRLIRPSNPGQIRSGRFAVPGACARWRGSALPWQSRRRDHR